MQGRFIVESQDGLKSIGFPVPDHWSDAQIEDQARTKSEFLSAKWQQPVTVTWQPAPPADAGYNPQVSLNLNRS